MAVHVAESPAESELLASGSGAFAEAWRDAGDPHALTARASRRSSGSIVTAFCPIVRCAFIWCRSVRRTSDFWCGQTRRSHIVRCPIGRTVTASPTFGRLLRRRTPRRALAPIRCVSVGTLDLLAEARAAAALADLDARRCAGAVHDLRPPGARARWRGRQSPGREVG